MSHWRTMVQSEHLCSADLWDEKGETYRNAILKIVKVAQGTVVGQKGRKKGLPFLTLETRFGKLMRAPFGANPTNCTSISTALGTPDAKKWPGRWIELYVTKVDSPDGMVDAIRIHPKAPAEPTKAAPPPNSPASEAPSDMTDADRRAIELAEREEVNRG